MPQQAWTKKQERQYEHIKSQAKERGSSAQRAKEVAARTVNKERARSGHAEQHSRVSTDDISSYRRGGLRSSRSSKERGPTKRQLYEDARRAGIQGISTMTKAQLERALKNA
ncbi:plasmid stabilization protein [Natronoglycomyces albus]|uniref:Plasmid stabilization protein n=1 Tax=Natronoglycomyces albus TaxID=2811108 RepID=A0A895XFN8_9ACTN|nr:plasmid stabilization protein [Natronoglycomyces albus]QSB04661.1 plasmid stabilization protein [Natronoglycomyces albus]